MIVFDSRTGNVKRFVEKMGLPAIPISPGLVMKEPFVLITYTTGFGEVPETTKEFLSRNSRLLRGVASSGNRNWGYRFALAADIISEQHRVPILHKFEICGTPKDITTTKERIEAVCPTLH